MVPQILSRLCLVAALVASPIAWANDNSAVMPPRMVLEPHHVTAQPPVAHSLAASPVAPLVAVASDRQVLLYHTSSLELLGVFAFPEGVAQVVRFSREGRLLFAGGGQPGTSGKVVVWDITTSERAFEVGSEPDIVLAADISADHKRIALGGAPRVVRVYATENGQLQYEVTKHADSMTSIEFSPDGTVMASADAKGAVYLWDAVTGKEIRGLDGHTSAVTGLSWRGDSTVLVSVSEDMSVRLWDVKTGTEAKNWSAKAAALAVEFTRDGRIVTSGKDQITRIWDQDGKLLVETPAIGGEAVSVTFCDETNRAIAASSAGAVQVYKADDGALLGTLATNPPTLDARLAAASQRLKEKTDAVAPLTEPVRKAEVDLAPVQTAFDEAKQQAAVTQKNIDSIAAEVEQINKSRMESDAERSKASMGLAKLQEARPLVAEAVRHLAEALGKSPGDAVLTESQQKLTEKLKGMETQTTELQAKNVELTTAITAADEKLKDANVRLEAARKEFAAATEHIKGLEVQAQQLAGVLETARKAAEPATTEIAAAQREVDRWKDEIAFRDQMAALQKELEAARQLAAEGQAALVKANEQLATVQNAANAVKAQVDEATRNADAVRAKIEAARRPK